MSFKHDKRDDFKKVKPASYQIKGTYKCVSFNYHIFLSKVDLYVSQLDIKIYREDFMYPIFSSLIYTEGKTLKKNLFSYL